MIMILIIDDDRAVRSSLSLLLKQAGYATATAEEPEEALTVAREHPPELFILDMNFPLALTGKKVWRCSVNCTVDFPQYRSS